MKTFLRRVVQKLTDFGSRDEHWCRVVMNRETRKLVDQLNPTTLDVLEISGDEWGQRAAFKGYRSVFYPEYDVCQKPLPERYDLIIAEQVFEHLAWPYRAGRNIHEMLRPGGHFLMTTPFLNKIHEVPLDCTRWSETGMKYFLAECGFPLEGVATGSWGNRACVVGNFDRWIRYNPWYHSLKNEAGVPIVVWGMARKADAS